MAEDIQNSLRELLKSAENIWIHRWFEAFSNPNKGFHERLDKNNAPIEMPRRLLSQCRQMIVYSLALQDHPNLHEFREKLDESFEFLKDTYFVPKTGGSIFSVNNNNQPEDIKYDLYAHAFIMLTCAEYYRATKNKDALKYAKTTFEFIKNNFKLEQGFAEALDSNLKPIPSIRRQNPHMHLMEACIFMYEASDDKDYLDGANKMLELFYDYFLDKNTQTLGEFFKDDLSAHKTEGHKIEAGHHGEWIWLLTRYQEISSATDPRIKQTINALFIWIKAHGIDTEYGGVFNVQTTDGSILDKNKRIWTIFETIRACSIMIDSPAHKNDAEKILENLTKIIKEHYIDIKTGNWVEMLNKELQPITDYMPATTPYHIYPILRETA